MNCFSLRFLLLGLSLSLISGCQSNGNGEDTLGWGTRAVICTGGGIAGAYIAKELAEAYFERRPGNYSEKEIDTYTKAFQLGLFISFCKLADYAGNTIYKNLSEQGRKEREAQVLAAAASSTATTYSDPSNPSLSGTVTPTRTYQETSMNRECVDMEDTLADGTQSETIYVKYCRELPNGVYQPTTA
ncbi:hypothetical protein [Aliiglaciecola lipolytica]|uniref:Lipoprotein n=1 Tax=Aliiglaciecola lipolytica E3 TaxID=1127673 RepID=K6YWX2_9ALTE|nr:hypothetical protein [Aliiglaciecola lipolytica]GAC15730.1 hypothetical protein GLIP_3109 [Aliiglaciecola lipolytica E3]